MGGDGSDGRLGPWARLCGEAKGDEGWRTGAEEVWEGTGRRDDLRRKIEKPNVFVQLCRII